MRFGWYVLHSVTKILYTERSHTVVVPLMQDRNYRPYPYHRYVMSVTLWCRREKGVNAYAVWE